MCAPGLHLPGRGWQSPGKDGSHQLKDGKPRICVPETFQGLKASDHEVFAERTLMRVQKQAPATGPRPHRASGAQTGRPAQPPWEQQPL